MKTAASFPFFVLCLLVESEAISSTTDPPSSGGKPPWRPFRPRQHAVPMPVALPVFVSLQWCGRWPPCWNKSFLVTWNLMNHWSWLMCVTPAMRCIFQYMHFWDCFLAERPMAGNNKKHWETSPLVSKKSSRINQRFMSVSMGGAPF